MTKKLAIASIALFMCFFYNVQAGKDKSPTTATGTIKKDKPRKYNVRLFSQCMAWKGPERIQHAKSLWTWNFIGADDRPDILSVANKEAQNYCMREVLERLEDEFEYHKSDD